MSVEVNFDTYRFDWTFLAHADIYFSHSESIYCIFSRALLFDFELMRLSDRGSADGELGSSKISKDTAEVVDQLVNDVQSALHLDEVDSYADEQSGLLSILHCQVESQKSSLENSDETELTRNELVEAGLPASFGERKRNRKRKVNGRSKKRNIQRGSSWLSEMKWEEYWDHVGDFLIYRTWLDDYGSSIDEKTQCNIKEKLLMSQPKFILPSHLDLEGYDRIAYQNDEKREFASWDELFSYHCEAVKTKAEREFEDLKRDDAVTRCKTFLAKVSKLGFKSGFTHLDYSDKIDDGLDEITYSANRGELRATDSGTNSSSMETGHFENDGTLRSLAETGQVVEKEPFEKMTKSFRRQFVNYGDLEMFSDVNFEIFDETNSHYSCMLDHRPNTDSTNESLTYQLDIDEFGRAVETNELLTEDKMKFDFKYNPERDWDLLAKNALQVFDKDKEIQKYWYQRFRLFSKLNEGILMDREGWFSVTPERVAEHIADRMVRKKDTVIVDAFAGVGGNSIQMALRGAFVIAIDLDPVKLKCAAHNAHVYGVQDRISFVCIDFFHFVRSVATESAQLTGVCTQHPFDAVFLSPPWGGPSYLLLDEFDLKNDLRPDGFKIFEAAQSLSPNIAYFLPRNTVISQIISLAGSGRSCEIEQNTLNKKLKAITAYYGDLIAQS